MQCRRVVVKGLACHIGLLVSGQWMGHEIMGIYSCAYESQAGWRRVTLVFELLAKH